MPTPWPQCTLEPLAITTGPCAWSASMLADHPDYIRDHPSAIVVSPDDPDEMLSKLNRLRLSALPLILGINEPEFSRRLPELVRAKLDLLQRPTVDALVLWTDDVLGLKGGGVLQELQKLQEAGVTRHIGIETTHERDAEWCALHTTVRLLVFPYNLDNQAANHRALQAAQQYGMACIATGCDATRSDPVRFSLAQSALALPVFDLPIRDNLTRMTTHEVDRHWQSYASVHGAPPPLPRSAPARKRGLNPPARPA